jgi:tRNA A37 threonylcarbamoyladenosine synthetase subunit TsaC/SUA5/YrdC
MINNCLLPLENVGSSLEAVNRIYEIKGRKHTSPLAICVGDVSDINRFALTDHLPHVLLDSLLPGPVTVVLRRGLCAICHFCVSVTENEFRESM